MRSVDRVESYGAAFKFEPPIAVRNDEVIPISLERLVVIATVGVHYPYSKSDQLIEDELKELIVVGYEDNPQYLADTFTTLMRGTYQISVSD